MKKVVVVAILALGACVGVADELSGRLSDCLVNKNNAACLKLADMYKGKDEKLASAFYKTACDLGEQEACAYFLKKQKGVYDKFFGVIERKLNENWNLYERNGNFTVVIEYQIESNGFFRYTYVTKSGNTEFDAKVMDFLSTLDGKYFATPPYKKPYNGIAILSDEVSLNKDKR